MRNFCFIFFILLLSAFQASAQSLRLTRFTEEEGLPSSLVKSVVRDKNGIIWAATDDGLVRFDGREFKLFQDELPGLYAKSVICLPRGEMLLTSDLGISRFRESSGETRFETIAQGGIHPSDSMMWFPKMFYSDLKNRVWLSDNSKVYRYTDNGFKTYILPNEVSTNNFSRSFSFADDGLGNFFAFSEPGFVFRYLESNDKLEKLTLPFSLSGINAVFNVRPGVILIATRNGLFELKTFAGKSTVRLRLVSKKDVSYMARNSKGIIYAGTWAEGLFFLEPVAGDNYTFKLVSQYPEKVVNHLFIDNDDNIWVSSDIGILLLQTVLFGSPFSQFTTSYIQCVSDSDNGELFFTDGARIFKSSSAYPGQAEALFSLPSVALQVLPVENGFWISDADAHIWFCNFNGKKLKDFNLSSRGKAVFKLMADKAGNIWACQDENESMIKISSDFLLSFYGPDKGVLSRPISLAVSANGRVFFGGMKDAGFLFEYDPAGDKFVNLSKPIDFERNIDLNVNDIACAPDGSTWLGSSFGLLCFKNGVYNRAALGKLTENSVKAVAVDSLGYVWLANNKGLFRYKNGDYMQFDERNGLPSKTIAYRGLLIDRENRMWAGTLAGMAVSEILNEPRRTLMPAVKSFLLNNVPQPAVAQGVGKISNKSFISLQVASPEYPSRQLVYERWIEGLESTWMVIANNGIIVIGGLEPGEYKLKVRARQSGNFVYSTPLIWEFRVSRIWYERWWVLALLFVALALIYRVLMLRRYRKLKSDNEKLEALISERTHEILLQHQHIEEQNKRIVQKNEALSSKNQELEVAKNLAEEAAKAKTQFLSVMSHEIRTPMNAVIGITHLLMRNNPRREQLEDLKILKFSAENLLGLINDILDLNKIEAGKLELESIDFNLKNLVEGVVSSMQHKAHEKAILIHLTYDEELPLFFISDPLRISQILNNLVSNAIKFTETGSVDISISQKSRSGSHVQVEFSVADTGIGIPPEMQHHIFSEFTQASSETSRKYGGTGLGLAITSKLLEMLGSEIQLKSAPGKGSEFSFTLELEPGKDFRGVNNEGAVDLSGQVFNGQRILLVEDNRINELIARKFMLEWNLKVDSASNGLEAIEKLDHEYYHLILMDLQMPEMDGYMTSSIIRARGQEPFISIPIIALTASLKSEVQEKITLAGMNDFVSKPFNPDELFQKLKKFLKVR